MLSVPSLGPSLARREGQDAARAESLGVEHGGEEGGDCGGGEVHGQGASAGPAEGALDVEEVPAVAGEVGEIPDGEAEIEDPAEQRGGEHRGEAVQIFTGYNTRWANRQLTDVATSLFRSEAACFDGPVLSHTIYLINLASPDQVLWRKSIQALIAELERSEQLGVHFVILHPGAHVGEGVAWVIVDEVFYADRGSWADSADGTGLALHRLDAAGPGSDAANWRSGAASLLDGFIEWPTELRVHRVGGTSRVTWTAFPGLTYTLDWSTDMTAEGWPSLGSTATNGAVVMDHVPPEAPAVFYRLTTRE